MTEPTTCRSCGEPTDVQDGYCPCAGCIECAAPLVSDLERDEGLCQTCLDLEDDCPCCAALDADDLPLAYLLATADLAATEAAGRAIPRERAA